MLIAAGSVNRVCPPLASAIHGLNDHYTYFLLQLTYQIPSEIDTYLITGPISDYLLVAYLSFASICGILWKAKISRNSNEIFSFI